MPTSKTDIAEAAGTRIGGDFVYHLLEFSEKVFEVCNDRGHFLFRNPGLG